MPTSAPRPLLRWLALAMGLVLALGLAEVLIRVARPAYEAPTLRTPEGRVISTLAEIAFQVHEQGEAARGPGTQVKPGMHIRGCYDRPDWDYFDDEGCVDYRANAFGFRDDPFTLEKPPGERRILALGDSFTFGVGVQDGDTWPQQLERLLGDPPGGALQVINGGFAKGHRPDEYAEWLASDGMAFDPDVVVVGLCMNDVSAHVPMLAFAPGEGSGSRLLDFLSAKVLPPKGMPETKRPIDFARFTQLDPEVWETTRAGLVDMQAECDQRDVRFVVALLPMLSQLHDRSPYRGLHELVGGFCRDNGIEHVDLLDDFIGHEDRTLWVHPTDQHPNDRAQGMIARGIAAWLAQEPIGATTVPVGVPSGTTRDASAAAPWPGSHLGTSPPSAAPAPGPAETAPPAAVAVAAPPAEPADTVYVGSVPASVAASDTHAPGPVFPTLAAAVERVAAGGTIIVGLPAETDVPPPGPAVPVTIDKPVRILGVGESRPPELTHTTVSIISDGVHLDRLHFSGRGLPKVVIEGVRDVAVTHCLFTDVDAGIELRASTGCRLEENRVVESGSCLRIAGGGGHLVRRNLFDSGGWHAVQLDATTDNRLVENHLRRGGWSCLTIHSRSTGNRIEGNTIEAGNIGLSIQSDGNTVVDNLIFGANHGLLLGRSPLGRDPAIQDRIVYLDSETGDAHVVVQDTLVQGNVLRGCQREGILLKEASGNVLTDNRIDGCGFHGIVLMGGSDGNRLVDNRVGPHPASPVLLLRGTGNVLEDNRIDGPVELVGTSDTVVDHDDVRRREPGEDLRPPARSEDGYLRAWGDLHVHSTLSDGTSFPEEILAYARDVLQLQFVALSDHAEAVGRRPERWELLNRLVADAAVPERFVTFPGYETTYASFWNAHYNVYFPHERGQVYASAHDLYTWIPDLGTITPFRLLEALQADGEDFFVVRHHFQDLPDFWETTPVDPAHLPMVEITSVHGTWSGDPVVDDHRDRRIDENTVFEGTLAGGLAAGQIVGVAGGGDSHYSFPIDHGAVAVLTTELSRVGLVEAIRARRTYATTGAPIALSFTLDGEPMGSIVEPDAPPEITIDVEGTGELQEVLLLEDGRPLLRAPVDGARCRVRQRLDVVPDDGTWLTVRVRQVDGQLAWSTPIWIRPGATPQPDPDVVRDKEHMTILLLAAVLRAWPFLPQPGLDGRSPLGAQDDEAGAERVAALWPRYVDVVERLNALARQRGLTSRSHAAAVLKTYGHRWADLPGKVVLKPDVDPLVDPEPVARALGF